MNSHPSNAIEKGFTRPIHKQRDTNAAPMGADFRERRKVDPNQHRDDHQPDQHRDGNIDMRDFGAADAWNTPGKS